MIRGQTRRIGPSRETLKQSLLVLGVGNPLRQDDGAGPAAARAVAALGAPGMRVVVSVCDPAALLEAWHGTDAAIVIDAMCTGAPPGTVVRLRADAAPLPAGSFQDLSTHSLGLAHAVELARTLGRLPRKLIVYGIEASVLGHGDGLSPEVAQAVTTVAERVTSEIAELSAR